MNDRVNHIVPDTWCVERLGDFVVSEKGKKPKNTSKVKTRTHHLPYVNIQAFEKNIVAEYTDGIGCVLCEEGDFLMVWDGSRSGYIGKAIKGALGSTLVKINFPGIINDYAYYFLLSKYLQINTRAKGTGTPHVDPDLLWNYRFPIAPYNEQKRIVEKIEELFSDLEKGLEILDKAQRQLKVYRQAVLKWAYEGKLTNKANVDDELPKKWEWKTLGQLFESVKNGYGKKPDDEGSKKILRISSVRPFSVDISDFRLLKKDLATEYEIAENDLLFTRYNGSLEFVGVCGRVPELKEKIYYPDKLIRCRPIVKEKFHAAYIEYAVNAGVSRKFILSKVKTTAGQTGISGGELKQVPIPAAPISEQKKIVEEIESRLSVCDKIEEMLEESLKQSEILRYSILKKAFEGRLVPQDPNDEPASILLQRIKAEKEKNRPVKKEKKPKSRIKMKEEV